MFINTKYTLIANLHVRYSDFIHLNVNNLMLVPVRAKTKNLMVEGSFFARGPYPLILHSKSFVPVILSKDQVSNETHVM